MRNKSSVSSFIGYLRLRNAKGCSSLPYVVMVLVERYSKLQGIRPGACSVTVQYVEINVHAAGLITHSGAYTGDKLPCSLLRSPDEA